MIATIRKRVAQAGLLRDGVRRRLVVGFGVQGLAFIVQTLLQFLTVPICLSAWGAAVYGDWLVLAATAGLLMIVDFGMAGHLTNGLRDAWARGELAAGQRTLQAGLGAYALSLSLLLLVLLAALAAVDLPTTLGIEHIDHPQTTLALLCLSTLLLLPRELTLSVYAARGQFSRQVGDFLALTVVQQGTVIIGALVGGSPVQVATAHCAVSLLMGWGVSLWSLRRRHPDVALSPRWPTVAELQGLAAKSPFYAIQQGGGVLLVQLPIILLGLLSAPSAVVAFSTMRTLTGPIRQFATQFAVVAGLEMARLHARDERQGLIRLYRHTALVIGVIVGTSGGTVLAIGPWFLGVWTHGAVAFDVLLAVAFVVATMLAAPAYEAFVFLRLIGRPQPLAVAVLAQAVAIALMALLLVPNHASLGAALAVGLAEVVVAAPITLRMAGRALATPILPTLVWTYTTAVAVGGLFLAVVSGLRAAILG